MSAYEKLIKDLTGLVGSLRLLDKAKVTGSCLYGGIALRLERILADHVVACFSESHPGTRGYRRD